MSAQALQALGIANRVKLERACVKRALRDGDMTLAKALDASCCATMRLGDLLRYYPAVRNRARGSHGTVDWNVLTLLNAWQITPYREVGELTARQRALVVERCP